jgi:hypothetical protein
MKLLIMKPVRAYFVFYHKLGVCLQKESTSRQIRIKEMRILQVPMGDFCDRGSEIHDFIKRGSWGGGELDM